jgi:cytochrome b
MTFWQAFLGVFNRRSWDLVILILVLVGGSVLAVVVGDRYGSAAGGAVGVIILPLVLIRLPRTRRRRGGCSR